MAPHANDVSLEAVTDTSAIAIHDPVLTNGFTQPSIFGINDVLPHRQSSAPMSKSVAAFANADMFKSKGALSGKKPKAKRWEHRLSEESKARMPSSLKAAMKYFGGDVISLCGGLPSSDYFPFDQLSIKVPVPPNFSEASTSTTGTTLTAGKHDVAPGISQYDLSLSLNYGQSMGPPQLIRFLTEHTEIVHSPPYSDWDICMTSGSTSALDVSLRMFTTRGEYLITEEYSFSSAMESARPLGLHLLGIHMDEQGLLPTHLDSLLSSWNPAERHGARKPFLLYTVPTGQNPTGATQSLQRRKAILAVAEKHDLFILEDEPYYFLQMPVYNTSNHNCPPTAESVDHANGHHSTPSTSNGAVRNSDSPDETATATDDLSAFLKSLIPSYLSLDTSGRVLRLDSLSKTLAPGLRTGWVTAPAQIIERFIRHNEVSAQNPSGFSEMVLYKLLDEHWSHDGFLKWLRWLRGEYTRRRDGIVGACDRHLPWKEGVITWGQTMAGMFHWLTIDLTRHPRWCEGISVGEWEELEHRVFLRAVEKGVLAAKGSWFHAEGLKGDADMDRGRMYVRLTFAAASEERIEEGVRRLGEGLREEFGLKSLAGDRDGDGGVNGCS